MTIDIPAYRHIEHVIALDRSFGLDRNNRYDGSHQASDTLEKYLKGLVFAANTVQGKEAWKLKGEDFDVLREYLEGVRDTLSGLDSGDVTEVDVQEEVEWTEGIIDEINGQVENLRYFQNRAEGLARLNRLRKECHPYIEDEKLRSIEAYLEVEADEKGNIDMESLRYVCIDDILDMRNFLHGYREEQGEVWQGFDRVLNLEHEREEEKTREITYNAIEELVESDSAPDDLGGTATSLSLYLCHLSLRAGFLTGRNKGRFRDIIKTYSDGSLAVVKKEDLEKSLGSSQDELEEYRARCLEVGVTEQELRAIEEYCGLEDITEDSVKKASMQRIEGLRKYTENYRKAKISKDRE